MGVPLPGAPGPNRDPPRSLCPAPSPVSGPHALRLASGFDPLRCRRRTSDARRRRATRLAAGARAAAGRASPLPRRYSHAAPPPAGPPLGARMRPRAAAGRPGGAAGRRPSRTHGPRSISDRTPPRRPAPCAPSPPCALARLTHSMPPVLPSPTPEEPGKRRARPTPQNTQHARPRQALAAPPAGRRPGPRARPPAPRARRACGPPPDPFCPGAAPPAAATAAPPAAPPLPACPGGAAPDVPPHTTQTGGRPGHPTRRAGPPRPPPARPLRTAHPVCLKAPRARRPAGAPCAVHVNGAAPPAARPRHCGRRPAF
jgi:hypothetical protein